VAYDEFLAERIQRVYQERKVPFIAKKMFGGVCFLVDDKMCTGVLKSELMVRIDPVHIDMDEELEYWINLAIEYNPKAKASKK